MRPANEPPPALAAPDGACRTDSPEPSRADDIMQIAALKVQVAQKNKEIAHLKTRLELADALINRERNKAK